MADNREIVLIELRQDSETNWQNSDAVLNLGEPAISIDESNKVKLKIGNGISKWSELPYQTIDSAYIEEQLSSLQNSINNKKLYRHSLSIMDEGSSIYMSIISPRSTAVEHLSDVISLNETHVATGVIEIDNDPDPAFIVTASYVINEGDYVSYCGFTADGTFVSSRTSENIDIRDVITEVL